MMMEPDAAAIAAAAETLAAVESRVSIANEFGRANGFQIFAVSIRVSTPDTRSARSEMIDQLRALASDIEAGQA